jgi:hypothetical protein
MVAGKQVGVEGTENAAPMEMTAASIEILNINIVSYVCFRTRISSLSRRTQPRAGHSRGESPSSPTPYRAGALVIDNKAP